MGEKHSINSLIAASFIVVLLKIKLLNLFWKILTLACAIINFFCSGKFARTFKKSSLERPKQFTSVMAFIVAWEVVSCKRDVSPKYFPENFIILFFIVFIYLFIYFFYLFLFIYFYLFIFFIIFYLFYLFLIVLWLRCCR